MYSKDKAYKREEILEKFVEKNCQTLAGKPKLFFIQADLETRTGEGKNLAQGIQLSTRLNLQQIDDLPSSQNVLY